MTACILAMQHNLVPPTINYEVPDPECDLDYVPNKARELKVNAVINNSFGFGGHNSSIVAKKFTS
jgi:3-oxoacyl-[acyl-carrier-protein] synthase II